jgi:hypothetical protein
LDTKTALSGIIGDGGASGIMAFIVNSLRSNLRANPTAK